MPAADEPSEEEAPGGRGLRVLLCSAGRRDLDAGQDWPPIGSLPDGDLVSLS